MWFLVVIFMQAKGFTGGGPEDDHKYEYRMTSQNECFQSLKNGSFQMAKTGDRNVSLAAFCVQHN